MKWVSDVLFTVQSLFRTQDPGRKIFILSLVDMVLSRWFESFLNSAAGDMGMEKKKKKEVIHLVADPASFKVKCKNLE